MPRLSKDGVLVGLALIGLSYVLSILIPYLFEVIRCRRRARAAALKAGVLNGYQLPPITAWRKGDYGEAVVGDFVMWDSYGFTSDRIYYLRHEVGEWHDYTKQVRWHLDVIQRRKNKESKEWAQASSYRAIDAGPPEYVDPWTKDEPIKRPVAPKCEKLP